MKRFLITVALAGSVFSGYSQEDNQEPVKYKKNAVLLFQSPIGIGLVSHQSSNKINVGYGTSIIAQKSFHDISVFGGVSFYQIKVINLSATSYKYYSLYHRSICIPIGVSFKYGQEKHLAYPIVSVSFNPTINLPTVSKEESVSSEYFKNDINRFTLSMTGELGVGFNVQKHVSIEFGGAVWLQFISISKANTIKPMVLGGFVGLNYNI